MYNSRCLIVVFCVCIIKHYFGCAHTFLSCVINFTTTGLSKNKQINFLFVYSKRMSSIIYMFRKCTILNLKPIYYPIYVWKHIVYFTIPGKHSCFLCPSKTKPCNLTWRTRKFFFLIIRTSSNIMHIKWRTSAIELCAAQKKTINFVIT